METVRDQFMWVEKYRPQTIEDCILPASIYKQVKEFLKQEEIPHFLFVGSQGLGKTTLAKAIARQLNADLLYINASSENGIDVLRTKIQQFASTISLTNHSKIVLLDEFDNASGDFQKALRAFTEQFARNCRFILTANYKNRIIDPLQSRCALVDFNAVDPKEKPLLASQFFNRVCQILTDESVQFDKKVVAQLIEKNFPDFRFVLNELQKYAAGGKIDSGILINISAESFKELVKHLKDKEFNEVRKWIAQNSDRDSSELYRMFYDHAIDVLDPNTIPLMVLILGKYQYQAAFVADHELNNMAAMTEIMMECKFK